MHAAVKPKTTLPVEKILAFIFSISCLIFTFTDQPFQVPDELQHFYRSYALASGQVMAERRGDTVGSELPSSLPETVEAFSKTRDLHADHPWRKITASDLAREQARPLDPARREFVAYPDSAITGPVAYLPQAIGMRIGMAFDCSPLELLYLGRAANALIATAMIWLALGRLAVGRTVAACFLMFPELQAQIASLSSDATLISLGFLLTAIVLQPFAGQARERRIWWVSTILGALLVTTKGVYAGLIVFAAIVLAYRAQQSGRERGVGKAAVMVTIILLATLLWGTVLDELMVKSRPTEALIDAHRQADFVLTHPLIFLEALVTSMAAKAPYFVQSAVALLGWGSIQIGIPAYLCAGAAVILAFLKTDRPEFPVPNWLRLVAVATFLGSWVLIETALYLRWTPVGSPEIDGVQGRYFLPVIFVLTLLQNRSRIANLPGRWHAAAITALATVPVIAAHAAILRIFY